MIKKKLETIIDIYKFLSEYKNRGIEPAVNYLKSLKEMTDNTEMQIKLLGFMTEVISRYDVILSNKQKMDLAEKWGVMDYVVSDIINELLEKSDW